MQLSRSVWANFMRDVHVPHRPLDVGVPEHQLERAVRTAAKDWRSGQQCAGRLRRHDRDRSYCRWRRYRLQPACSTQATFTAMTVPEPTTLLLLGSGVVALAGRRSRFRITSTEVGGKVEDLAEVQPVNGELGSPDSTPRAVRGGKRPENEQREGPRNIRKRCLAREPLRRHFLVDEAQLTSDRVGAIGA